MLPKVSRGVPRPPARRAGVSRLLCPGGPTPLPVLLVLRRSSGRRAGVRRGSPRPLASSTSLPDVSSSLPDVSSTLPGVLSTPSCGADVFRRWRRAGVEVLWQPGSPFLCYGDGSPCGRGRGACVYTCALCGAAAVAVGTFGAGRAAFLCRGLEQNEQNGALRRRRGSARRRIRLRPAPYASV